MGSPANNEDGFPDRLDRIERMLERTVARQDEQWDMMRQNAETSLHQGKMLDRVVTTLEKVADVLRQVVEAQALHEEEQALREKKVEKEMAELRESQKRTDEKFAETTDKLDALIAIVDGIVRRPPLPPAEAQS